jgi:hypothetical protein
MRPRQRGGARLPRSHDEARQPCQGVTLRIFNAEAVERSSGDSTTTPWCDCSETAPLNRPRDPSAWCPPVGNRRHRIYLVSTDCLEHADVFSHPCGGKFGGSRVCIRETVEHLARGDRPTERPAQCNWRRVAWVGP